MINCKGISNRGENRTVRTPAKSVLTLANFSQGMRIFSRVKIKKKNLHDVQNSLQKFALRNCFVNSLNHSKRHCTKTKTPCKSLCHLATPHLRVHHLHQRPPLLDHMTSLYPFVFTYYISRDCSLF